MKWIAASVSSSCGLLVSRDMTSAVTKNVLGGNGGKGWGNFFLFFMYDRKLVAKAWIRWVI